MAKIAGYSMRNRIHILTASLSSKATRLYSASALLVSALAVCLACSPVALADTLGYPWPTDTQAPCEFGSNGGSSCTNPSNSGDLYDWYVGSVPFSGNPCGGTSPSSQCFDGNGYEYRNCTSYTAWRLNQVGVPSSSVKRLGNGGQWYNNAPASEQSTTPAAWDAAVEPGTVGHVAFVESVNGTQIKVSEYNEAGTGAGDTRTGTPSSLGLTKFVDFGVHPSSTSSGLQLMLDSSGDVWAKSTSSQGTSGWNEEATGGEAQVVADDTDGIQLMRDTSGNVWAKSSTDLSSGGWTEEATGVASIAAGGGLQFIINSSGYLYSKSTSSISSSGWNIEINGGVTAVAADHDNTLQMALDSSGNVWAKSTSNQGTSGWNEEQAGGQQHIATGGGIQMMVDTSGNLWAKSSSSVGSGGWTEEVTGGVAAIAAGDSNLQLMLDTSGNVWAKSASTISSSGWSEEASGGEAKIAVGGSLQLMLDTSGNVWSKSTSDTSSGGWTQEVSSGQVGISVG